MKIYSVYYGNRIRKGITVRKKGNQVLFLSFDYKKGSKIAISIHYPEIISASVTLPDVADEETKELLTKNRLSNLLSAEKEYIFLYFEKEKISQTETLFDVYALPYEVYQEAVERYTDVDLLTIDVFSLISFDLEGITFHFYSDSEKILISVYKEQLPLYTRAVSIPENLSTEKYINFLYENFSVTYSFVTQNKKIDIDQIIISGENFDNPEFIELIYNQTRAPLTNLLPFVKGITPQQFNEFLIEIGTALTTENFNFLPPEIKREKIFSRLLKNLTILLLFLLIFLSIVDVNKFINLKRLNEQLTDLRYDIETALTKINSIFTSGELDFYRKYFELANVSISISPDTIISEISNLLLMLNEDKFEIKVQESYIEIHIDATQQFNSLIEMEDFKENLNTTLAHLKEFDVKKSINENIEKLELEIHLFLRKPLDEK
ncbi:hypothetical protein [Persephonella sp. IF05-L8]|uniref:hypothetical protein n=1 Tax=Persephonella sp. IF05-L8 TaxID=1158338 RepID=UPI000495C614